MKFLYKHQEDTYEFELSNGVAVQLVYLDPPFNSSLRLIKEGTKLFGISLKNDGSSSSTVEKISRYFTTEKDLTTCDETFLQKLVEWNLPKFAERAQEAIQQISRDDCRLA